MSKPERVEHKRLLNRTLELRHDTAGLALDRAPFSATDHRLHREHLAAHLIELAAHRTTIVNKSLADIREALSRAEQAQSRTREAVRSQMVVFEQLQWLRKELSASQDARSAPPLR